MQAGGLLLASTAQVAVLRLTLCRTRGW